MPSERSTSCRRYAVALQAWAGVRPSWHGQALCASEERAELLRIMARAMLGRHAEELLDEVVSDETDRGGRDDLDVVDPQAAEQGTHSVSTVDHLQTVPRRAHAAVFEVELQAVALRGKDHQRQF